MSTTRTHTNTRRVYLEPAPSRVQLSHLRELVEKTQDFPGDADVVLLRLSERHIKGQWTAQSMFIESLDQVEPAAPQRLKPCTTPEHLALALPDTVFRAPEGRIYTQIRIGEELRLNLAGEGWYDHAEVIEREKELLAIWEPEGDA